VKRLTRIPIQWQQAEIAGDVGAVLNLAGETTEDGYKAEVTRGRQEAGRARAEAMQTDFLPDVYEPRHTTQRRD
jgi:hypothetical protein